MSDKKVYIFPSCASKLFDNNQKSTMIYKLESILRKLNYEVIFLSLTNECCGLMYDSMGQKKVAEKKLKSIIQKIKDLIGNSKAPILVENSSCVLEFLAYKNLVEELPNFKESIAFIHDELKNYPLKKQEKTAMLHINCSVTKLKKGDEVVSLAKRCVSDIIIPNDILCCGFAGSKGFIHPELNINALKNLQEQIPENCHIGYTCLETCTLGFSKHSGIPYSSIYHLIDECM
ncbi:(Fe-S)-binding protein [Fluviispira vulneris]|uniref:(Fe-S)-binding protein n=1 Tax=Fluviispira vulneris TaxID=2763012 RepID=UPI00164886E1|nr:(Fe-S)-binding protein [Fluviispira vulneris]